MALQGVLLSLTFVCIYVATTYVSSGVVAIVFSLVAALNMVGMRVFFGLRLRALPMLGAVLGVFGVALIFGPISASVAPYRDAAIGLSVALAATLSAALASMVIVRNQCRGIPLVALNGFSLLYGAASAAIYALLTNKPFDLDWNLSYVGSLLYLSVVGSVLVFAAYLELIRRMGADRAGYTAVAVPVIALLISSIFEGLRLDALVATGLLSCAIGNILTLSGTTPRLAVRSTNPLSP
jgi:drug/metabolite transporter (DMT)-like permease